MDFETIKEQVLAYLKEEKSLIEADLEQHKALPFELKVEQGFVVPRCRIIEQSGKEYELTTIENNSKLRAGDRVTITDAEGKGRVKATVIENSFTHLVIELVSDNQQLSKDADYDVYMDEVFLNDIFIQLFSGLDEYSVGSYYLKTLFNLEAPYFGKDASEIPVTENSSLNTNQQSAVDNVMKCPSVYSIQGPPGTGKTAVLAQIALEFCRQGYDVLIVSNTHHAVNNAMNEVVSKGVRTIKIGPKLRAADLKDEVIISHTYSEYLRIRPKTRMRRFGEVVGMTIHGSVINLGLRTSGFSPAITIVDEAGQIPFAAGAAIGTFGSPSIILIGDDRQLPPIFHPNMKADPLSKSIFSHVSEMYPAFRTVLVETYRMNTEITDIVNRLFYEPYGITLHSHRKPVYDKSVETHEVDSLQDVLYEDYNPDEAITVAELALKYILSGKNLAVLTPFRKQVNCIKTCCRDLFTKQGLPDSIIPLIDTVDRLQGQSVDIVILSMSVSNPLYYQQIKSFILDLNRLNVMISRAKDKVIVVKSKEVEMPFMLSE